MQANPLWPVGKRRAPLDRDLGVDVLVVGGGMAGISSALGLMQAGREVALIERDEIGGPSTGASSGVLYYGSGTNFVPAVKLFGQSKAQSLWSETSQVIAEIKDAAGEGDTDCGLRSCGAIMVAQNENELSELEEERSGLAMLGLPAKLLQPDELRSRYPLVGFMGGLEFPAVGQVHPARLASGLAEREALQVYEGTPSMGWEESSEDVTVTTPKGRIRCSDLVVATNLEPFLGLEKHFDSEGSVILASAPSERVKDVFPEERIIWTMEEKYDIIYPRGDRLILELYSLGEEDSKIGRYFPGVNFQTDQIWGENWAKPRDFMPIVGKVSKRTAVAIGMGDQGITMSWLTGKKMPDILDGKTDWFTEMTSPRRLAMEAAAS